MISRAQTDAVRQTVRRIRKTVKMKPKLALVLGSGLGRFADRLAISHSFSTSDFPHYPTISVQGHSGKIHFGWVRSGKRRSLPLVVFQGRTHFYESGSIDFVTFPIDLACELGAGVLIVTNAAGGINRRLKAGDFMMIEDLISLSFTPIAGASSRAPRPLRPFRTVAQPFDVRLQQLMQDSAREAGIRLHKGVYCWLKGPSYETPAEIEMLSRLGVDTVGMSTVPEVVRARSYGMRVVGLSVISNMAAGIELHKLSHKDVTRTANRVRNDIEKLLITFLLNQGLD